jgi:hypothetical protein
MRTLFASAALAIALSSVAVMPVAAQQAQRDAVIAACSGPSVSAAACDAAVAQLIAIVRTLPAAEADALLADLVVALAESGTPATQGIIAAVIVTVAAEFNDPARGAVAIQIAAAVEAGDDLDPVITQALASPT